MGQPLEAKEEGRSIKVSGYAAVFDEEVNIAGIFREKIEKGAFAEAVKKDDVVFLANHTGLPFARTRSGTLRLAEDDHGLKIETELDLEDPDVKAIIPKMKRGDLDKMSFAFIPVIQEWSDQDEEIPLRIIRKASLIDVSIVNFPAYDGTEIGLRSLEEARKQFNSLSSEINRSNMRCRLALASRGIKTTEFGLSAE